MTDMMAMSREIEDMCATGEVSIEEAVDAVAEAPSAPSFTTNDVAQIRAERGLTPQGYDATKGSLEMGKLAAEAVADIQRRDNKVPVQAGQTTRFWSEAVSEWVLRESVGDVTTANWNAKVPTLHSAAGRCLRPMPTETQGREWMLQQYRLNTEAEATGGARTHYFCTRCILARPAKPSVVTDGVRKPKVERDEVTGQIAQKHGAPCPTCQTELPLTGDCQNCSDGRPAAVTEPTLVDQVKAYAVEHYDAGWDVIVEAYTDEELLAALGKTTSFKAAIKKIKAIVDAKAEQLAEVMNA